MSSIGKPCERQLWYDLNFSEQAEPLRAETYLKFLYGDILEELLLYLAESSGHDVTGRQDTLAISGVEGHRDAVIDGITIDCKSASSPSFKKFVEGLTRETDGFGYLGQLRSYVYAGNADPLVRDKHRGGFLVIDKTLGHVHLDLHTFDFTGIEDEYARKIELVKQDKPPERGFDSKPFGQSGNRELVFNCSYCPFMRTCWPEVRTFIYSNRPVHLVQVVREPNVPEIKKDTDYQEEE